MSNLFKKIRNELWLISYQVKEGKVIEVHFSAKEGSLVGWCQRKLFMDNKDAV